MGGFGLVLRGELIKSVSIINHGLVDWKHTYTYDCVVCMCMHVYTVCVRYSYIHIMYILSLRVLSYIFLYSANWLQSK